MPPKARKHWREISKQSLWEGECSPWWWKTRTHARNHGDRFETIEPFILGDLFPEKSTGWSEARVVAFLRDHREIITGEGATFFLLGAGYILGIGYERSQFSAVLLHEGEDIPFTAGQRVALLESS